MIDIALYLAAATSALTFLAHVFIGGQQNAKPIFSIATLPNGPKWTMVFSWQSNSILLLFMACAYAWAAYSGNGKSLVVFLTALSTTLCLLAGFVASRGEIAPWKFPPAMLFAVISFFGALAIWS